MGLIDEEDSAKVGVIYILLGNLPGSVDYFVSTGGSGGGAHAVMLAATGDNPDFYGYEAKVGAVGVYQDSDGNYITSVTIDGKEVALSDSMWGCMAYSAITSLAEADMALAFEYNLDPTYSFNTDFQQQVAKYLSASYLEYINGKAYTAEEAVLGFDLNGDGDTEDTIELVIEESYSDEYSYTGTYVDMYLAEFEQSLNDYLARLDYAEDWTWFNSDGEALSDSEVAAMTSDDRALAFIEGRYAKGSTGSSSGGMEGGPGGDSAGGPPDMSGDSAGGPPDMSSDSADAEAADSEDGGADNAEEAVGTPDAGTTQSASSSVDSANYETFEEMLESYKEDIAEIESGDEFGKNIVTLYNPINYIGGDGTTNPTWARILCGASEGDISMLNSLNLELAWLSAGTDADIEWQWDGGHVPSEILGDSLPLYVDIMYGKYVEGATEITKAVATGQTANGTATEATGTDISDWVSYDSENGATFSIEDIAAYRTSGASKAIPGFDVMDYGQEDYVFGSAVKDAHLLRGLLIIDLGQASADSQADLLSLIRRGDFSGADGPDRLVSYHDSGRLRSGHSLQRDLHLLSDQIDSDALFTLSQGLAHADDRNQAGL